MINVGSEICFEGRWFWVLELDLSDETLLLEDDGGDLKRIKVADIEYWTKRPYSKGVN